MDLKRAMKLVFFVAISRCFCSSDGHKFFVGGTDGWVLHPSEDYADWAQRNRFLVNDTLYFKYKKGEDSVLEVTKDDYYNCNTSNGLLKMENGPSEFKLARSGPFFFISGVKDHCDNGQKLLLIVLSESHRTAVAPSPHPPAVYPSPSRAPLASSPTSITHSPAPAPLSSTPRGSLAPADSPLSSPAASAEQSTISPGPSSSGPEVASSPEMLGGEAPPTPAPAAPQKAAASAVYSALQVSFALIVVSSLFL